MTQLPRATAIVLVVVLAALACVPLLGSDYLVDLATQIIIYVLFALSLNVLIGYSGNVSFGHAAYFAIGGYGCSILLTTYDWPLVLAFPAAVVLAGVASAAIGYFCVKLTDIYFAMLTLAFAMFVWGVAFKWRAVTGGDDGFVGLDRPEFLMHRVPHFYFALIIVTLSAAALWVICHSAFGRTLVAVRENRVRAGFVGVDTRGIRHVAFIVAGTFAGIAGALFALYNNGMYVESAFWPESARVLIMVLLGGMYSFFGPALGAAVLYFLQVATVQYTEYWPTVLGLILLVILMFVPEGIVGLAKRVLGFTRSAAPRAKPESAAPEARPREA
jgi:branched-chain amino acid transport system permease protein